MISIIIGLGNIGEKYRDTRHNIGWEAVEIAANSLKSGKTIRSNNYIQRKARKNNQDIIFAWPTTLMNRSGTAIANLLVRYNVNPTEMLVVVDDVHLPLGALRFRTGGSDGGHNGLASIIDYLETEDFPRLRLGIGSNADNIDRADYVLEQFDRSEDEEVKRLLDKSAKAAIFAICHPLEEAMAKHNYNPVLPDQP